MTRTAHRRLFYRVRRRSAIATAPVRLYPERAIAPTVAPMPHVDGVRLDRAELRIGRHDRVLLGKCLDIVTGENRQLTDAEWRRTVELRAKLSIIKPA